MYRLFQGVEEKRRIWTYLKNGKNSSLTRILLKNKSAEIVEDIPQIVLQIKLFEVCYRVDDILFTPSPF